MAEKTEYFKAMKLDILFKYRSHGSVVRGLTIAQEEIWVQVQIPAGPLVVFFSFFFSFIVFFSFDLFRLFSLLALFSFARFLR